ncbi:MAG TPA: F0F1 ATP synthase subunit alpha [Spirochaetia bacterium]|nr:F0F1 ATP synthase subunit alpha [Spirochaetia bacterium]
MKAEELVKQIEEKLGTLGVRPEVANVGRAIGVADGIVRADGLSRAGYGEQVEFEDGRRGLIMNLDEDVASILVLSEDTSVPEGMEVRATGTPLSLQVSEDLLGRVIDPFGTALDGKPLSVSGGARMALEKIAPGVTKRAPVDKPLKTGVKAVDALTPIGRGQRQLLVGDRNTGKTAIVVDTIINQRRRDLNLPPVICVYCAIGQKRGNIAAIVQKLQDEGAMAYTIVVAASASTPASMQYLAPFAACAIGEYFMAKGQDALVVYDDLSRHAWAYRQISLLLARPAGREAYPGDIFYLHSRLLERAARMSSAEGGGSLTALPIIQTQAGDISAYIPTNVISITDGQIYLETDLFNSGVRPAVNAGLSVSRVGGKAQSKALRQVSGVMRLELAQYQTLAAFSQFGSDLDEATQKRITRGKRIVEILKQPQFAPMDDFSQVIAIHAAGAGLLDDVPLEKVIEFERRSVDHLRTGHAALSEKIATGGSMDAATVKELEAAISELARNLR